MDSHFLHKDKYVQGDLLSCSNDECLEVTEIVTLIEEDEDGNKTSTTTTRVSYCPLDDKIVQGIHPSYSNDEYLEVTEIVTIFKEYEDGDGNKTFTETSYTSRRLLYNIPDEELEVTIDGKSVYKAVKYGVCESIVYDI